MSGLSAQLTESQERERVLQKDMKKKGDLARQLLAAKDDEMRALNDQLVAMREAAARQKEEREKETERDRLHVPASPVPGPVTGAALAAMTPVPLGLGSASLEIIELTSTPAFASVGGGTAHGAGGLGTAMRPSMGADAQSRNTAALRMMQNQVALLASENQALKSRLLGNGDLSSSAPILTNLEREQYLRQAFCALFRAKEGVEMQNLARVMCAILGLNEAQQGEVLERCEVLGTVNAAQSAVTNLSTSLQQQISSLFA